MECYSNNSKVLRLKNLKQTLLREGFEYFKNKNYEL